MRNKEELFGITFDNFSPSAPSKPNIAQEKIQNRWKLNCNGYVGWLIYNVNHNTGKLEGTLLGISVEGFHIDRRISLHRYPEGKNQIYEGWIIGKRLGAPGKSYYDNKWIISGSMSESGTMGDGEYPWFGVSE